MPILPTSPQLHLNELLTLICEKLQLPPTLHREAEIHYDAVRNWLNDPKSDLRKFFPEIYSQGSFRIGTTTRPIGRDEYDVDLVCELALNFYDFSAETVLDMVEKRLRENKIYENMVERKKRCIRLTYAKQFHLDILPAAPEIPANGTSVRVPDRELNDWLASNPKGYASWFEQHAQDFKRVLESKDEPLPDHETIDEKMPLQIAVQLLKRWRDLTFKDDPDNAPRSIVLTTLAGQSYTGQLTAVNTFQKIIEFILKKVKNSPEPLKVYNPTNDEELLSERWVEVPESYTQFVVQLNRLIVQWNNLLSARGIQSIKQKLASLFGEEITFTVLEKYTKRLESFRTSGSLGVDRVSGILTTTSTGGSVVSVKANTFYGKE